MTQFQNIEQSQKTLHDYVFASSLNMSNDLRQLILDFAYPRYVWNFNNANGEKCWIRLRLFK